MPVEHEPDAWIQRDGHAVRQILHLARPFVVDGAASPVELAAIYLQDNQALFGLDRARLASVDSVPPRTVTIRAGESVAVVFAQVQRVHAGESTAVDLPVWDAGIRLTIGLSPLRLTAAYSTLRHDLPRVLAATRVPMTSRDAAEAFGIPLESVVGIFVHEAAQPADRPDALRLAPVLIYNRARHTGEAGRWLPYREHLDLASGTVVGSHVLASHADAVKGLVFQVDPHSQLAQPRPEPHRPADELDARLRLRELPDLGPPAGGAQALRGTRIEIAPDNPLQLAPPTAAAGADFRHTSRSDRGAAVSAYHHCDAAFRMVEGLGFPLTEYFAANVAAGEYPVRVVHRAPIPPGRAVFDGRTVNAQVVASDTPRVVGEIRFALGDLSDPAGAPLGIATDPRFAWHELGHALLIAATGEPEFRFAHGPGDALAAIICDLDSRIGRDAPAWRGVTFPWVEALRRHDRDVGEGWGWHGSLYDLAAYGDIRDPGGYRAEQILSSTLFQLYRALGGDAIDGTGEPDLPARQSAAAYTVYLLLWAIRALDTPSPPALDAYALAGLLMAGDVLTPLVSPSGVFPPFAVTGRRGGAVRKVVRWAFERQGLYAPAGRRPWDAPGLPPRVDVFVEDGRHGEYPYAARWHAGAPDLRVVSPLGAAGADSPPQHGTPSHVFVRVRSRGSGQSPVTATVQAFAAPASAGPPPWRLALDVPGAWVPLGASRTAVVPPGAFVDVGPFPWSPLATGRHGLLACVDAPGDRCNALAPLLACAVGPTPLAQLVPFDNNIAYREVDVLS